MTTLSYFEVGKGVAIFNEDTGKTIVVAQGDGTGDINNATVAEFPVGSIYTDTLTGKVYTRTDTTEIGIADWGIGASETYVDSQLAIQVSWREPVLVRDNTVYANIAAAQTAANVADTVNGVTIAADDRILFSNLTSGNDNVYIVSGTSGAWIFTEDTNLATPCDTVYVEYGTDANSRYTYNASNLWVLSDASSSDELGYIRTFIGKNAAGSETPNYSSTTNVTQSTSLETAIGAVDAAIGSRSYTNDDVVTDAQSVAASINALDQTYGSGSITNTTANYPITSQAQWNGGSATITTIANNLNDAVGDRNYATNFVVTDGQALTASIDALDTQAKIGALYQNAATNVALSNAVVSSIAVGTTPTNVIWQVYIREHSASTKTESFVVHAIINSAGTIDFSKGQTQKTAAGVTGLSISVVKTTGNLELRLTTTNNATYRAQILHVLSLA